jgi:hypothetical protein
MMAQETLFSAVASLFPSGLLLIEGRQTLSNLFHTCNTPLETFLSQVPSWAKVSESERGAHAEAPLLT